MNARVLVVDSHPITRWGISRLIEDEGDLSVVGQAGTADEAIRLTHSRLPDVVTIGLDESEGHGLPLAQQLRDRFDDLGLVILTAATQDDVLLQAFETGASAFLSKAAPVTEIVAAVRHASVSASSFTASGLAAALRRRREAIPTFDLSARERQVLDLLVRGHSVRSVSDLLHISESTAKTYVSRVYEKLGARNRAAAVMAAVRLGLTDRPTVPVDLPRPRPGSRSAARSPGGVSAAAF
jgi:DNA-binding NarL/FixJ family response regulator